MGIEKASQNENTPSRISKRLYQDHFIISTILDGFMSRNEITLNELYEHVVTYIPKDFIYNMPFIFIHHVIIKMCRLGLIEPVETEDKNNPKFKITPDGLSAYKQYTFQSLASSSFFNYQTHKVTRRMFVVTIMSVIVAVASVIVTICSFIK
jgi:hypothetical protein